MGTYFRLRFVATSLVLITAVAASQDGSCKDSQGWCNNIREYCGMSGDMKKFCPKTCGGCSPAGCDECEDSCITNDDGSHECTCQAGYQLKKDRKSCEDINECEQGLANCGRRACRNYPGGFECLSDICVPFRKSRYVKSDSYEGRCCKLSRGECGNRGFFRRRIPLRSLSAIQQHPWAALIVSSPDICAGTLISLEWVAAAAGCIGSLNKSDLAAYFSMPGASSFDNPYAQKREIKEIVTHEDFEYPNNDIALLKLERPVVRSDLARPACLPFGELPPAGAKCFLATYKTENLSLHELTISSNEVCGEQATNGSKMICAGRKVAKEDRLAADEMDGSLLCQRCDVCDWFLAGISPRRVEPENEASNFVFASIEFYEKWIETKIDEVKIEKKKCEPAQWGSWAAWSECSRTCHGGRQTRSRRCINGKPRLPGCLGKPKEARLCTRNRCPYWSRWTGWSKCTATCGGGFKASTRRCINGKLVSDCNGRDMRTTACNKQRCKGRE